ncbi:helix-turn-helix domain-containing protein [Enterococcus pseudoavium]|uniref:helix-turn-helix domain-containing protein n=1 Tax=Enterococcus pseudoavium TaxID=44007 RepID=UPI0008304B52|nr:helix-turn-helix domain-containing protein [Enterococcus pseudoavium]
MYLTALELQNYEKDIYLGVHLLEQMADGGYYKRSELATALQLDVRSVQRLLEELSKKYRRFTETDLLLFEERGQQYHLVIANQMMEQNQFLVDLIRHSVTYQLLNLVVIGKARTVSELSQQLFCSESTIRRKIKALQRELKPLQLTVERGVVSFQAAESVIRMYLSVYYWRLFRGKDWPFAPLQHDLVRKISNAIQQFFQVELNPIKEQRLKYLLATHLLREVQGYSFTEDSIYQQTLVANSLFQAFYQQVSRVMPTYFRNKSALSNLFLNLLTREEYYHVPAISQQIHQLLRQAPFSVMDEVAALNQVLKNKINNPKTWEKFQALQAENYLISGHLYQRLFPMIQFNINGKLFWTKMHEQQAPLVAFITESLRELGESDSILFGRYLSVLRRLPELTVQPVLRIFLQTDLPEFEENIIIDELRQFLSKNYQVVFVNSLAASDICLTTSLLDQTNQVPTLAITEELQMTDYLALLTLLQGFGGKSF